MIADSEKFNEISTSTIGGNAYGRDRLTEASPDYDNQDAGAGISPQAVLHSLRRSWKIAFPVAICLAAAGAAAGWLLLPPQYEAARQLRISGDTRPLIFLTADQAAGGAVSYDLFKNTQMQMIVQPFVLNAALRDKRLDTLPVVKAQQAPQDWLKENLQVSFPGRSEIMEVSIKTESPSASIHIVNAVVDAYLDEVVLEENRKRDERLTTLQDVHTKTEEQVREARKELKKIAADMGTTDSQTLNVVQQSVLQRYGVMQEKLSEVQFELMQAKGGLDILNEVSEYYESQKLSQENVAPNETTTGTSELTDEERKLLEQHVLRTPDILNLEGQLSSIQAKYKSALQSFGSNHPTTKGLAVQVASAKELLEDRIAYAEEAASADSERRALAERLAKQRRFIPGASVQDSPSPFDNFNEISMTARIGVLEHHEDTLENKVLELEKVAKDLVQSSIDIEMQRSEIGHLEGVLTRVGEEIQRTKIERKKEDRIKAFGDAESATPPDLKKRYAAAGGLGTLGLLAPFALIVFWDLQRKNVDDAESASDALSVSAFGTIPKVDGNPLSITSNGNQRYRRQRTELSESIDAISSMILHHANRSGHQVFMVTSALAGEGKSTTTCQLGESLARSGKRVAIVDFDLRRPSISRYMNLERAPGVSEALHHRVSLKDALQQSEIKNLSVLTAGSEIGDLYERSTGDAIGELFDELRQDFDVVIVDACPVLPVVDSRIIATYCDGVLLTLFRDKSRLPAAVRACELLRSYGGKVLGTIVIGARPSFYSNVYKYTDAELPEAVVN